MIEGIDYIDPYEPDPPPHETLAEMEARVRREAPSTDDIRGSLEEGDPDYDPYEDDDLPYLQDVDEDETGAGDGGEFNEDEE